MSAVAVALPTLWASETEQELITRLCNRLTQHESVNLRKRAYYEGEMRVEFVGISLPPSLRDLSVSVGWAGTAVDVMNERLEWYGWRDGADRYGLDEVYRRNKLDLVTAKAHLDALVYGVSFLVVGDGDVDEPHPLITEHSPRGMTALWDNRVEGRLKAAVSVVLDEAKMPEEVTLYLPDETVRVDRTRGWYVADRVQHGRGMVPVVPVENRAVTEARGRSEITKPVRYYVDNAVRTMAAMEVHREFYAAPQRYGLNIAEDAFTRADGTTVTGWESVMGRIWAVPYDEDRPDGQKVEVGQFPATAPTAYAQQLEMLAGQFSAETGIPVDDLGVQRANQSSEGALLAAEKRLIRRTEFRQRAFTHAYDDLARLVVQVRDRARSLPELEQVSADRWRAAATPSRAAIADETAKYVGAGVLPAQSQVTWDRMGLSPEEQRQLRIDLDAAGPSGAELLVAALGRQQASQTTG